MRDQGYKRKVRGWGGGCNGGVVWGGVGRWEGTDPGVCGGGQGKGRGGPGAWTGARGLDGTRSGVGWGGVGASAGPVATSKPTCELH
jgi:hypothetical protein